MIKRTLTITLQPDWKAALRQAGHRQHGHLPGRATTGQFGKLCELIGAPEPPADPPFVTNKQRNAHRDALKQLLEAKLKQFNFDPARCRPDCAASSPRRATRREDVHRRLRAMPNDRPSVPSPASKTVRYELVDAPVQSGHRPRRVQTCCATGRDD